MQVHLVQSAKYLAVPERQKSCPNPVAAPCIRLHFSPNFETQNQSKA